MEAGLGFGVVATGFSTRGTGVGTCPKAVCPIKKLMAIRMDNRRKSMEFERRARKTSVYLAERSGNASKRRSVNVYGAN